MVQFASYIRHVLCKTRLIFPRINGSNILLRKLLDYDIPNHILCWITDFLLERRQGVKLAQDCFSEWRSLPAGVPQGNKNRAVAPRNNDECFECRRGRYEEICEICTISEMVYKGHERCNQQVIDDLAMQARDYGF